MNNINLKINKFITAIILFAFLFLFNTVNVLAAESGKFHRIFISSSSYNGNLGGLSGADTKCQAAADTAKIGGTWKAWLSDGSVSASSRLNHGTDPYKLLNGNIVAENWGDLTDGKLNTNITIDENKSVISGNARTWTNTNLLGEVVGNRNCSNWSAGGGYSWFTPSGQIGNPYYTDLNWTNNNYLSCNSVARLYCVEQTTQVTNAAIAPIQNYSRVFVSSKTFNGNLGGVYGANLACRSMAALAGLNSLGSGVWGVWISDPFSTPTSRFTKANTQYKLLDGKVIAEDWEDLISGNLDVAINIDENGRSIPAGSDSRTWTSTYENGTDRLPGSSGAISGYSATCSNWNSSSNFYYGWYGESNGKQDWSLKMSAGCGNALRLYCFEQIYTYPSAPKNISAKSGIKSINLSWAAPISDGGAGISGYKIYRKNNVDDAGVLVATIENVNNYTDLGLLNDSEYYYQISAFNNYGEGKKADVISGKTFGAPPAPKNLGLISGMGSMELVWDEPDSDGRPDPTSYKIYELDEDGREVLIAEVDTKSYLIEGLTFGTIYNYQVSAVNELGEGVKSMTVSASPMLPEDAGYRRMFLTADSYTGNLNNQIGADAACQTTADSRSFGGEWKAWLSGSFGRIPNSRWLTHSDVPFGLLSGAKIADNWDDLIDGSIQNPININEFGIIEDDAFVWTGVDEFGSGRVVCGSPENESWTSDGRWGYSGTVGFSGSTDGIWMTYENFPCSSANRLYCVEQDPPVVPESPLNLNLKSDATSIILNWDVPYDGRRPIEKYNVYRSGKDEIDILIGSTTSSNFEDRNIPLTNYVIAYSVTAVNIIGEGEKSDRVVIRIPDGPENLQARKGDRELKLSWEAPNSDGGAIVTGYKIYRGEKSGEEKFIAKISDKNVFTYLDKNLLNGKTYYYRISALNVVGEGEKGPEVSEFPEPAFRVVNDSLSILNFSESTDPTFEFIYPRGGEQLYSGTEQEIRWRMRNVFEKYMPHSVGINLVLETSDAYLSNQYVRYSSFHGYFDKLIIENSNIRVIKNWGLINDGRGNITIPSGLLGTNKGLGYRRSYYLEIYCPYHQEIGRQWCNTPVRSREVIISPNPAPTTFTIINPAKGILWTAGTNQKISWIVRNLLPEDKNKKIDIHLLHKNSLSGLTNAIPLALGITNTLVSEAEVRIPENVVGSGTNDSYSLQISCSDDYAGSCEPGKIDISIRNYQPATFTFISPTIASQWQEGSSQEIRWKMEFMRENNIAVPENIKIKLVEVSLGAEKEAPYVVDFNPFETFYNIFLPIGVRSQLGYKDLISESPTTAIVENVRVIAEASQPNTGISRINVPRGLAAAAENSDKKISYHIEIECGFNKYGLTKACNLAKRSDAINILPSAISATAPATSQQRSPTVTVPGSQTISQPSAPGVSSGSGSVGSTQPPVSAPAVISGSESLTLTAIADSDSIFTGWFGECLALGECAVSTSAACTTDIPCNITINKDQSVQASFIKKIACVADVWSCGDWAPASCSSGDTQSRICTKTFDCPSAETPSPSTSQSCASSFESGDIREVRPN